MFSLRNEWYLDMGKVMVPNVDFVRVVAKRYDVQSKRVSSANRTLIIGF